MSIRAIGALTGEPIGVDLAGVRCVGDARHRIAAYLGLHAARLHLLDTKTGVLFESDGTQVGGLTELSVSLKTAPDTCRIHGVNGPTVIVEMAHPIVHELVHVHLDDGSSREGQVLEICKNRAVVLLYEGSHGISGRSCSVERTGRPMKMPVSDDLGGRIFDGTGKAIDGGPAISADDYFDVDPRPLNPTSRVRSSKVVQTGISAIDVLFPLYRGQRLPIFSAAGLPHNEIAAQICCQASLVTGKDTIDSSHESFSVVVGVMGASISTSRFFQSQINSKGSAMNTTFFLNMSNDPTLERILTPRMAMTTAEYFAYSREQHVLVVLTDMSAYAHALAEVAQAVHSCPGRRGFPSSLHADFAAIYERAGCVKGCNGSITQVPILTMPNDDITHPLPDVTASITDGQIRLQRSLHNRQIYPPIDVISSLSRRPLKPTDANSEKHAYIADQLQASYALSQDVWAQRAVVGEESLEEEDRMYLRFSEAFEDRFLSQPLGIERGVSTSLDIAWELLNIFEPNMLKRIPAWMKEKHEGD